MILRKLSIHQKRNLKALALSTLLVGTVASLGDWSQDVRRDGRLVWAQSVSEKTGEFEFHQFHWMSGDQVEVVLRERLPTQISHRKVTLLANHLLQLCERYRMDPALVLSLIQAESSFRTDVISSAGAVGLMQVMPLTEKYVAQKMGIKSRGIEGLKDPFYNLRIGIRYLSFLKNHYHGWFGAFLAAYNAGPTRVDKLIAENRFIPKVTRPYIEKIREGVAPFRVYGLEQETRNAL